MKAEKKYSEFLRDLGYQSYIKHRDYSYEDSGELRKVIDAVIPYYNKYLAYNTTFSPSQYIVLDHQDRGSLRLDPLEGMLSHLFSSKLKRSTREGNNGDEYNRYIELFKPTEFFIKETCSPENEPDFESSCGSQLYILVGFPGVGKTRFIEHFERLAERFRMIGNKWPNMTEQDRENEEEKLEQEKNLEFFNLARSLGINNLLVCRYDFDHGQFSYDRTIGKILYALEECLNLKIIEDDPYDVRIKRLREASFKGTVICFVDNIDRAEKNEEEMGIAQAAREVFNQLRKSSPSSHIKWVVTISMRRSTVQNYFIKSGSDLARSSVRYLLLPSPPIKSVFRKRFQIMEDIFKKAVPKKEREGVVANFKRLRRDRTFSAHASITLEMAFRLVGELIEHLDDKSSITFLHNITLGGVRSQIRLLPYIFRGATFPSRDILRAVIHSTFPEGQKITPLQGCVLDGKINIYDIIHGMSELEPDLLESEDIVCWNNLFDNNPHSRNPARSGWLDKNKGWNTYLVKIRILQYLQYVHSEAGTEGTSIKKLLIVFERFGYHRANVISSLVSLSQSRLVLFHDLRISEIAENPHNSVHISDIGVYYLLNLLNTYTYFKVTIRKAPLDFSMMTSGWFLNVVNGLCRIKWMEDIESNIINTRKKEVRDLFNDMTGGKYIWEQLRGAVLSAIGSSLEEKHLKNDTDGQAWRILDEMDCSSLEMDRFDDPYHPDPRCVKCVGEFTVNYEFSAYRNQVCQKPVRMEPIKRILSPESEAQNFAAEAFFMQRVFKYNVNTVIDRHPLSDNPCSIETCRASKLIDTLRKIHNEHDEDIHNDLKKMDKRFIMQILEHVKDSECYGKVTYVTFNISSDLFGDVTFIDLLRSKIMGSNTYKGKIVVELPENLVVNAINIRALNLLLTGKEDPDQKLIDECNENPQILIAMDDMHGEDSRDLTGMVNSYKRHIKFVKMDYNAFQRRYLNDIVQLSSLIVDMHDKYKEHGTFTVIEGVEKDHHLDFLLRIRNRQNAPLDHLCIQGYGVKWE
ncbi:MAG: hypothetical protein HQL64_01345 [Magnetococcales bacterium]|nr:hypothetical protein [Magnetococcales bacterium]